MRKISALLLAVCFMATFMTFAVTAENEIYSLSSKAFERGDADGNGKVEAADAIHLLYHVFFGEGRYPISQSGDFDGNGEVEAADAIYLLYNVFFGSQRYPLYSGGEDVSGGIIGGGGVVGGEENGTDGWTENY